MPSPLSLLLDAIQRSPTAWHRLGGASRQADVYAAAVAEELAEAPEERRAGLLEARMVAPVGPWERLLTYGQWVRERAREVEDEGVTGGGKGEGWWPDVAGRDGSDDGKEAGGQSRAGGSGVHVHHGGRQGGDEGQHDQRGDGLPDLQHDPGGRGANGGGCGAGARDDKETRPRAREQLADGPEARARIAELRAQYGRAEVHVRWGRRWTANEGKGVVSYPAKEG